MYCNKTLALTENMIILTTLKKTLFRIFTNEDILKRRFWDWEVLSRLHWVQIWLPKNGYNRQTLANENNQVEYSKRFTSIYGNTV